MKLINKITHAVTSFRLLLAIALLLSALVVTGLGLARKLNSSNSPGNDPDRPDRFSGRIDETEFRRLRDEQIAFQRGFDPKKPFDPTARSRAINLMENQMAALARGHSPNSPALSSWVELGPAPIPNGQTESRVDPVSGRLTTMVIDPTNSNILYIGTAQGGVWRSLNGGTTFTPIFDTAQSLAIGALTLDPNDHTRLWVGTGEPNGSGDSYAGVGLYRVESANTVPVLNGPINPIRSYNDGGGMPQMVAVFNGRSISKILVDPLDSNIIFASTAGGVIGIGGDPPGGGAIPPLGIRGLYRLSAATGPVGSVGVTRIGVRSGAGIEGCFDTPCTGNRNVNDMVFDTSDATFNTLILWLNGTNAANDGGVWRSTDALAATPTFTRTLPTTSSSTSNGRGQFAIYKPAAAPSVIYVASGESTSGALKRSVDGGVTWSAALAPANGFCDGQCFYNIGLAVVGGATTATDRIHLGGNVTGGSTRLHGRSLDGGATFSNLATGLHADTHFIYVDPNNSATVYHGNDGGLWKSTDSGATWTSLNAGGIKATQFSGISVHPTDPNFTVGGTQDNGTNNLLADGLNWNRIDFGDGGYALIDRNAVDTTNITVYHTYFNQTNNLLGFGRILSSACAFDQNAMGVLGWSFKGIYGGGVSVTPNCDGSDTFNGILLTDAVLFYAPMELGPGNPNTVYFGAGALYRSTDKGNTMPAVSQRTTSPISTVAVSPQDDNYRMFGRRDGSLFFTTTGANPLTDLDPSNAIPNSYVGRIIFDPADKNVAYIGLGGFQGGTAATQSHMWKATSLDTVPVLTAINGSGMTGLPDVPINALASDTNDPTLPGVSVLYVGTDIGVYRSTDGGATWSPFGTGLPRVAVFGMAIQEVKRVLRIATHGRGMWENDLPSGVGVCTLTCPANITVSNNPNQCGAVVNYPAPTTSGTCGTVSCSPASGSFFPVGTTMVTCNSSTGGGSCSFTVTVNDNQAPIITCPANISQAAAPCASSAVVNYPAPTTSDNCPGVTVSCTPASGSSFPVGTTPVSCTATDASSNTSMCSFNVQVTATLGAPTLTTNASPDVALGSSISDAATLASGCNPTGTITFRLYGPDDMTCGGAAIFTSPMSVTSGNGTYASSNFTPTMPGTYRWVASYGGDANNNAVAGMCNDPNESVVVAAPQAVLRNLSTRMRVETGDNVGIGGFIIQGSVPKRVIIRAIGPDLMRFGLTDLLADPVLELHGTGGFVTITNDNWRDTQESEIASTLIPPVNDAESAIVATLDPGQYTAIVRGKNGTSGLALVEVYDLDPAATSTLINLSTRAKVNTGQNLVIAGFILGQASGNDSVVIRGLGPSLTAAGVPNVLPNPALQLRDRNGTLVRADNDWQDDPAQAVAISGAGLALSNPVEAGIFANLPAGGYTALLTGEDSGTGIGLVEIYQIGPSP